MAQLDYLVWDADSHYYEPRDCFTRYIEPRHRHLAIRSEVDADGVEHIMVGDRPYRYTDPVLYDRVQVPGSLQTMLRAFNAGETSGVYDDRSLVPMDRAYQDHDARLNLMDKQGVEACMMFPGLGVCVEPYMFENPLQTYANITAFNRWIEDDWGFAYRGRIFAPAVMSLLDLESALTELDRLLNQGVRVLYMRPGPQGGRSPADPYFDPFWARIDESRIPIAYHSGNTGYVKMYSSTWSEESDPLAHHMSAFQWTNFFGDRPLMDTLSALILHNLFGRFPNVRVTVVEHGSLWVQYLLKHMDKMMGMGRTGRWLGGPVRDRASVIFKQHVWVAPFHEEDCVGLVHLLGANRVLMGSDFPHAEGLATPAQFMDSLGTLSDREIRAVMRDNLQELLAG